MNSEENFLSDVLLLSLKSYGTEHIKSGVK